ncbi:SDR family oxidoreductase [Mangrovimicrobium sediminis]|uniref:SDR family oxidoreductase n=1 Tax=Mangrovimicrobium sediminis TaxID=2562682 RepID=A0A4Z0LVP8_9GAMM|nr:SDR family oxidoreductase [Haliea sp. SAOS-164]TGD71361.1 SDR family oxidoreductase [Haliea sp. SAOS-164]
MPDSSSKPVALVTGASSGIGDAIARKFAANGFDLVVVARRRERLEQLAAELADQARVEVVVGDVTDPATADNAVKAAMDAFGHLDCLVNNAGSGIWAPVGDTTDEMMDEVIDISLKGPFRFCRAAVKVMQPGSSIINIGSVFGVIGGMTGGVYCAVKAGLIGLTQAIAADYGANGVRCNVVAPGVIRTEMTDAFWEAEPFQRSNQEQTPFDRDGTMADVASTVYFLASEGGSYINGQTIALDGGWSTTKFLCKEALLAERVPQQG